MTERMEGSPTLVGRAVDLVGRLEGLIARMPASLASLALRIAAAMPFFKSGLTKWDGFLVLSDSAPYLFAEVFRLHILGAEYPFPAPGLVALLSGLGETILPVLLVLGLGTRFAALGLLAMTAVIQLTVPDGWETYHLPWAAMLLGILVIGPGRIALDAVIARVFARAS